MDEAEPPWIELQQRPLDDGLIPRGVHPIHWIGTSVFVASLALACEWVGAQEATG